MIYEDLSYLRFGSPEKPYQKVYPEVRYIGWLDEDDSYAKGEISESNIRKLKEMLFLDLKYAEDRKKDRLFMGFKELVKQSNQ